MDRGAIDIALDNASRAAAAGESIASTGFWKVVAAVKGDPGLVDDYGDRISAIDDRAFRSWALLVVPLGLGTLVMVTGTTLGLGLIWWAYFLDETQATLAFLAGFGILLVSTHGLGHLVVGRFLGIRFTAWFIGTWTMPQPGVKTDYSTYLRAPASSRAWMHASGAIVTKLVPFALIGAATASGIAGWAVWLVAGVGLVSIITDIVWSTGSSDWKKYRREMRFAHPS